MATATKKAAAKKAAPAKKTAAKKAAAPKPKVEEEKPGRHSEHLNIDADYAAEVVRRRDAGEKWDALADAMETTAGKALLAYMWATIEEKDKVKGDYEKRRAAVPGLRDDGYSWGQISVMVDLPESNVRAAYEELRNESTRGLRVGRGGRYPNDADRPAPKPKAAKAPAKKVVKKAAKSPTEMTLAELKDALDGGAVLIELSEGGTQTIKVKEVKKLVKGAITLTDDQTGATRTIKAEAIKKIGRKRPATKN